MATIHSGTTHQWTSQTTTCRSEQRGTRPSFKAISYLLIFIAWAVASIAATFVITPHHEATYTGPTKAYVVHQGDTVSAIAETLDADQSQDVRVIVQEIMTLNHLGDATIQPGQVLEIPTDK